MTLLFYCKISTNVTKLMGHLDDVEEMRYVQIRLEVLGVNVNLDSLEMHLNSARVRLINYYF